MNTNTNTPAALPEQRKHDVSADQEQCQQPLAPAIAVGPKAIEHGANDDQGQKGEATGYQGVNILGRHAALAPNKEAGIVADSYGSYLLEIENIGGDTYTLISRGHHDPAAFMVAVRKAAYDWPLGMPQHM